MKHSVKRAASVGDGRLLSVAWKAVGRQGHGHEQDEANGRRNEGRRESEVES